MSSCSICKHMRRRTGTGTEPHRGMDRLCAPTRGGTTTSVSRRMMRSGPIPASWPSGSAVALPPRRWGHEFVCQERGARPRREEARASLDHQGALESEHRTPTAKGDIAEHRRRSRRHLRGTRTGAEPHRGMHRLWAPRGRTTTSVSRRMVRSGPIPASSPSGSAVALRGEAAWLPSSRPFALKIGCGDLDGALDHASLRLDLIL